MGRREEPPQQTDSWVEFRDGGTCVDDPLAASQPDPSPDEERWQTIGMIGGVVVFVVHTWPQPDTTGEEIGRIISARKATSHERKAYEENRF